MKVFVFLYIFMNTLFLCGDISSNSEIPAPVITKIAVVYSSNFDTYFNDSNKYDKTKFIKNYLKNNVQVRSWYLNYSPNLIKSELDIRAKRINDEIVNWHPDLVISVGNEAFEHYLVEYNYKITKYKSIFCCLNDYAFKSIYESKNLKQYNNMINGSLFVIDFTRLKRFLTDRNVSCKNIYVIQNSELNTNLTNSAKAAFGDSVDFYLAKTEAELTDSIEKINNKDAGIILLVNHEFKSKVYNRNLTKAEISSIFKYKNFKNLEISINENMLDETFAVSYSPGCNSSVDMNPNSNFNLLIYNTCFKGKTSLINISNDFYVSTARVKQLKFNNILNNLEEIENVN